MEIHVKIVLPDGFLETLGIDDESMIETHNRMPVTVKESEVRDYLTDYQFAIDALSAVAPELVRQAV